VAVDRSSAETAANKVAGRFKVCFI
jgi:hypothetical protein